MVWCLSLVFVIGCYLITLGINVPLWAIGAIVPIMAMWFWGAFSTELPWLDEWDFEE